MIDIKTLLSACRGLPLLSDLEGTFPTPPINPHNVGSYNRRLQGGRAPVRFAHSSGYDPTRD
ncbi:hypothetical protein PCAR4_1090113 [Paraburkholderia caribensis]|nr:hypothetical protein PCAR4_1090113 [Paraburkholderia caribensis]